MNTKSRDTRPRAQLVMNAYIEALVGVFTLHLPAVQEIVRMHAPEISVESSYSGEHINLQVRRVIDECQHSGPEIIATVEQVTFAFVAAMWDMLTSHAHYEKIATQPEIQFFRHLRNASGHDGRWNFTDLKYPAIWRDKELCMEHKGNGVFQDLLKHGDVVLLFIDIDRMYFEQ